MRLPSRGRMLPGPHYCAQAAAIFVRKLDMACEHSPARAQYEPMPPGTSYVKPEPCLRPIEHFCRAREWQRFDLYRLHSFHGLSSSLSTRSPQHLLSVGVDSSCCYDTFRPSRAQAPECSLGALQGPAEALQLAQILWEVSCVLFFIRHCAGR